MNDTRTSAPARAAILGAWMLAASFVTPALARDVLPVSARTGVELARGAARTWSEDAQLVYVENDEPLAPGGTAPRWGYLFYSRSLDASRVYSVREDRIVAAENLDIQFEAPPLSDPWIDSGAALSAAGDEATRAFGKGVSSTLTNMLLIRGALQAEDPDETTWMLVYAAPSAPSLFVVVDATSGKVRRTWRG